MLILRDMRENDIEDYVRWFTAETEWSQWDAPWEELPESSAVEERRSWTAYYDAVKDLAEDTVRWKYEIEADGKHIGWISSYTDLGYLENPEKIPAVGLDIPGRKDRNRGYGTEALRKYLAYLMEHGHRSFYTQTWSGNCAMMRTAEKLGFREICRKRNFREVCGKLYDAVTYRLDLPVL